MRRKHSKSFVIFSLLIFLFFIPLTGGWLLLNHNHPFTTAQANTHKHGSFIDPIIPMASLPLSTKTGAPLDLTLYHGKWILLYFNNEPCSQSACSGYLTKMSQIQASLSKNHRRLIPMWATNNAAAPFSREKLRKHLTIVLMDKTTTLEARQFYLVDPYGNLILSYNNDAQPETISRDLQRLMKI